MSIVSIALPSLRACRVARNLAGMRVANYKRDWCCATGAIHPDHRALFVPLVQHGQPGSVRRPEALGRVELGPDRAIDENPPTFLHSRHLRRGASLGSSWQNWLVLACHRDTYRDSGSGRPAMPLDVYRGTL